MYFMIFLNTCYNFKLLYVLTTYKCFDGTLHIPLILSCMQTRIFFKKNPSIFKFYFFKSLSSKLAQEVMDYLAS